MRIEIRDYVFDGRTHWVAVVDGATVSVAYTLLEALTAVVGPMVESVKAGGTLDPASVADPYRSGVLTNGWTMWAVLPEAFVIVDDVGILIEEGFDSEAALLDYIDHMNLSFAPGPSGPKRR